MTLETVPLIALLFVFCAICQWAAWRIRLPAILLLLLTGITAGPVLGLVRPEELLGDLLFPFVSLSVAIILFEGSLTLRFRDIRGLQAVVRNLVSIGTLVTWFITTLATRLFMDISWEVATLFGAIMVVTGPTVIAPILRTVRPIPAIANTLKWESIVIDPIGASLAVLVFEFIISGGGGGALGHTLLTFTQLVFIGALIGAFFGHLFGLMLRYHIIPEFLHNVATLGLIFASFALANSIQPESGLVTVTVFGMWLANMKNVDLEHILAFKETLSILLISLLFIILAARLEVTTLEHLSWNALLICLVLQFLARPLSIMLATAGSSLTPAEKKFLAWIAPRGIVAAAISSLFALKLEDYGYSDAVLLVPLTFMVIIFTVLVQSLTAYPIARLLRVTLPDPDGFLVIGANPLARAIAGKLLEKGKKVVLAGTSLADITEARRQDIPVYFGNPISEHAERNLELFGLGTMLGLSSSENENIAAAFHFREEFGKQNIFTLPGGTKPGKRPKAREKPRPQGATLFGGQAGYLRLAEMLEQGAAIEERRIEERLAGTELADTLGGENIPLFGIDPKGGIHFYNDQQTPQAEKGWLLVSLGFPPDNEQRQVQRPAGGDV